MKSVELAESKGMINYPSTAAAFRALNLWNTNISVFFDFDTFTIYFDEYRPEFLENQNV